jgi:transcriptional regulator with XRE-family HTH domain
VLNGKNIKKVRGKIKPEIFAEMLGISPNYLRDLEAERRLNPSLWILLALKRVSKMPADYFLKDETRRRKGGSHGKAPADNK